MRTQNHLRCGFQVLESWQLTLLISMCNQASSIDIISVSPLLKDVVVFSLNRILMTMKLWTLIINGFCFPLVFSFVLNCIPSRQRWDLPSITLIVHLAAFYKSPARMSESSTPDHGLRSRLSCSFLAQLCGDYQESDLVCLDHSYSRAWNAHPNASHAKPARMLFVPKTLRLQPSKRNIV